MGFRIPPRVVGGARANDGSAGVMRGIGVGFGDKGFPGNGYDVTKVASEGVLFVFFFPFPFPISPSCGHRGMAEGGVGVLAWEAELSLRASPLTSGLHPRLRGEWIWRGCWGSAGREIDGVCTVAFSLSERARNGPVPFWASLRFLAILGLVGLVGGGEGRSFRGHRGAALWGFAWLLALRGWDWGGVAGSID